MKSVYKFRLLRLIQPITLLSSHGILDNNHISDHISLNIHILPLEATPAITFNTLHPYTSFIIIEIETSIRTITIYRILYI